MLDQIATAVNSALERDLPDVEGEDLRVVGGKVVNVAKSPRRPDPNEIEIITFPQTWGSGALGFPGGAGMTLTTAQTVVVSHGASAWVYFGGRFAYVVENWRRNQAFNGDLRSHRLASQMESFSRYE